MTQKLVSQDPKGKYEGLQKKGGLSDCQTVYAEVPPGKFSQENITTTFLF